MPIDEEEWTAGKKRSSTEKEILAFLYDEYPQGYSADELVFRFEDPTLTVIVAQTESDPFELERERIRDTLDDLVRDGLLQKKTIETKFGDEVHYRANGEAMSDAIEEELEEGDGWSSG